MQKGKKWIRCFLAALVLVPPAFGGAPPGEKGGEEETGPYTVVAGWPQPLPGHEGWTWGSTGGIFAERADRVFILQRGELPVPKDLAPGSPVIYGAPGRPATEGTPRMEHFLLIANAEGKITDTWPQHDSLFLGGRGPHKIKISPYDPEKRIWIVDDNLHQVFQFSNDGRKLLLTLGEKGVAGNDERHFGRPTDIAWLPDGTFFISDGYVNARVVKFDASGKFLMSWGRPGTGPGEFNLVHAVDTDAQRRIYVADRSNSRIQVFDENGKYLDQWPDIRMPMDLLITARQEVWVLDGATSKVLKYDLGGRLLSSWGTYGQFPGGLWGGHQMSVDPDGNLYISEVFNGRAQKFRPRPGIDASRFVGQPPRQK